MKPYDKKEMLILAASTTLGLGMRFARAKTRPHKIVKELNRGPAHFAAGFSALAAVSAIGIAANQVVPKDEKTISPAESIAGLAASSLSMAIGYKVTEHLMKGQEKLSTPRVVVYTALGLLTPALSYAFKKGLGVATEKMASAIKDQALTDAEKLAKDLENAYKEYVPDEEDIAVSEALKSRRAVQDAKIDFDADGAHSDLTRTSEEDGQAIYDTLTQIYGFSDKNMSEESKRKTVADLAEIHKMFKRDVNEQEGSTFPKVSGLYASTKKPSSDDDIISDIVDEHIKPEDDSTDDSKKD